LGVRYTYLHDYETERRTKGRKKKTVTKGGLIRVVIYLSPEERKALKQAALDREMPASEVVREALRTFLELKIKGAAKEMSAI